MPKFRCYVRSCLIVEAENAEEALDAYEESLADYGFRWLDCTGVEDCGQDLDADLVAGEGQEED